MTTHFVDNVQILLWPNPLGLSAFAPPFVFDLEWNTEGLGTIDASLTSLSDFPNGLDRYRALSALDLARIHQFALANREQYESKSEKLRQGYLVRQREPGIDQSEFLSIVAACTQALRRRN